MLATALVLLCAASTPMARRGGFCGPEETLDPAGTRAAASSPLPARFGGTVRCSPWRSARDTAEAMGLDAAVEPALADSDHGRWTGRAFDEIGEDAFAGWLVDPLRGAPGGEAMAQVQARIGAWLDHIAPASQAICAITHPMTIRAALAQALGLPPAATLAIDIAPLSRTVLSFNGRWRLQALIPN